MTRRTVIVGIIGLVVWTWLWSQDARAATEGKAMIELLAQSGPSDWKQLGATVVVVALFLGYLLKLNLANNKTESKRMESMEKMSDKCHEHTQNLTDQITKCVDRNTEAMIESARSRKA